MKFKKPIFWRDINFFSLILLPLSVITFLFNHIKKFIIKEREFDIPIICVGNISVGGTGKTPLSVYIHNILRKKKFKPAIVRKYYSSHLDEILLIKSKIKQFYYDNKRSSSILKAEQKKNNVIIMDDGLQDASIKKTLGIVCFNSIELEGNGFLIPAGPLRESLNKLKECQIVVINGKRNINFEKKLKLISSDIKIFQSKYKIKNNKKLKGKKVLAFAGIGNPESFFRLLKENNFIVKDRISFPDHYQYSKREIQNIILNAKKRKLKIITTEKDYFRIKQLGLRNIQYVSIDLKIIEYKTFEKEILQNL